MRTAKLEDQQPDHELHSHSPCDGLPLDLSAVGGKKPGDDREREETSGGDEVMNHCFLAKLLMCVGSYATAHSHKINFSLMRQANAKPVVAFADKLKPTTDNLRPINYLFASSLV